MTEHGDFASEFEAIVGALKEEQRDPIVTELLGHVHEAETALNRAGEVSSDRQTDVLATLNNESYEAEISRYEVIVSGRVRPADFVGADEDEDNAAIIAEQIDGLGALLQDDKGPYYYVSQQVLTCGDFDLVTTPAGENQADHKIIVYLNPTTEDDESDGWLYAYPDELEVLVPREPSYLKVNQEIRNRYQGIAAQIDALPENCGDDEAIIAALKEVRLDINWRDYPHMSSDEQAELIDHIEQYITNRVVFDSALYLLAVHGLIIGVNSREQRFVQPLPSARLVNGYIGHVRLLRELDDDGGADDDDNPHYQLMLEVFAPAEGRQNGDHLVYVPLSAIDTIQNTRNDTLFSQEMTEFAHPFEDNGIVPGAMVNNETDEGYDEEEGPEYTVEVDVGRAGSQREKQLAALNERIQELYNQVDAITSQLYDSEEAAVAARMKIDELITEFNALYPQDRMTVIEAVGPGVRSMNVSLDDEGTIRNPDDNNSVILKFNGVTMVESDILTVKRGVYAFHAISGIGIADADESKYGVEALLVFADVEQPAPITFGSPELNLPLFTLSASKRFIVRLDGDDTRLSIPEYERLKKCRESIQKIALKFPDLQYLPWQLNELQETIDAADPSDFQELDDISLVRKIGETVGGDEEASQLTVDALMDILGEHPIELTGPMYLNDGTYVESQEIQGLVENVISSLTTIPTEEPMLMMTTLDQTWYVPLSTIERFRY